MSRLDRFLYSWFVNGVLLFVGVICIGDAEKAVPGSWAAISNMIQAFVSIFWFAHRTHRHRESQP